MAGKVVTRCEGATAFVILDNETRLNAISLAMWRAIPDVLSALEQDSQIRLVILRGAGDRAFSAGADISEFESTRGGAGDGERYDQAVDEAVKAFGAFQKPVIAMIRGFCIGGGLAIATMADIRIASENALFAVPAARLGICYGLESIRLLVNLVGPSRAKVILFGGERLDARTALTFGLTDRCVANEELEATIGLLAAKIAENAPLSVMASKKIVNMLSEDQIDSGVAAELAALCFDSSDYAEGRRAFMEKRKPIFRGA